MNDLISKQAAIEIMADDIRFSARPEKEYLIEIKVDGEELQRCIDRAAEGIRSAQQWIPCSERLPEDDSLMLVNYIDNRPDAMDVWIGWHEMENVWYIDGEAHSKEYGNEVIAWMPLPEPYKGEEHETN